MSQSLKQQNNKPKRKKSKKKYRGRDRVLWIIHLRELRLSLRISIPELCRVTSLNLNSVKSWEAFRRIPRYSRIERYQKALKQIAKGEIPYKAFVPNDGRMDRSGDNIIYADREQILRIEALRLQKKVSRVELSHLLGRTRNYWSNIMNGKKNLSIKMYNSILPLLYNLDTR